MVRRLTLVGKEEQHAPQMPESQYFGDKLPVTPPALIKGVLPETGVAWMVGQSGSGKTFQALHLGACLIPDCKKNFYIADRYYPIKRKGGVLYFVLEGRPAFPMRVAATFQNILGRQRELWDRPKLPFAWNSYQPNLYASGSDVVIRIAEREAAKMRQEFDEDLVAIFFDTIGLAALFENEDKAAQIIKVISDLQKLSSATGALVVPIDHMGKDDERGARGSSAKVDLPETVLECLGDRGENGVLTNLRMRFRKIRDSEAGRIIPYRLNIQDMGKDEDGDPITTCTIQWEPDRPPPPPKQRGPRNKTDAILQRAIQDVKLPADETALRAAFYNHHGGSSKAANMAWHRAFVTAGLKVTDGRVDYEV
jgi:hypothetical protein